MESACPGLYCGRIFATNGTLGECGPCPRGYKVNEMHECTQCLSEPSAYDILFLGFMFMLPLIMHCYFINIYYENVKQQIVLLCSAITELVLSAMISILLVEPVGTFSLYTCGVKQFSDWYTLFYNPYPNYQLKLHCTQEAVYPLQTIVLIFYFISLLKMILIRTILSHTTGIGKTHAAYSALYFFPLLMLLHTMTCGLIYYGFPYLSIILSMITNAWHQAVRSDHTLQLVLKGFISQKKNLFIIGGHWFLLAYGVISLKHDYTLLVFVPIPFLFYILTFPFTDPNDFLECEDRN